MKNKSRLYIIITIIFFFGGLIFMLGGSAVNLIVTLPDMFDMSINTRSLGYISYKSNLSPVYNYSFKAVIAGAVMHLIGRFMNENM